VDYGRGSNPDRFRASTASGTLVSIALAECIAATRHVKALLDSNGYPKRPTQPLIVNYGERYRNGERISTGFVESTINQVVSKRMVKKQQMQWTPEGAHLLLQVRTQVLNDDWEATFRTWYPGFRPVPTAVTPALLTA